MSKPTRSEVEYAIQQVVRGTYEILKQVIDENPHKSPAEHLVLFRERYWETNSDFGEAQLRDYNNGVLDHAFNTFYAELIAGCEIPGGTA